MAIETNEVRGVLKEFREFALKGNVADMAVGIIIGAGFGKIVSSFVSDIINPPLGLIVGGVDFKGLEIVLKNAVGDTPAVSMRIGNFLQTCFDFTIQAFAIFVVIKALNRFRRKNEANPQPAQVPAQERLLGEIRDLLQERTRI